MMSLELAADALHGTVHGPDAVFTGVSIDTRSLKQNELFVAIQGPNHDGHHYLAEAIAAGASGALLSRQIATALPYVLVSDTRRALGELASFWRQQFDIPLVAITGSNGKTTVKEMLASILWRRGRGCVTQGNLNNDIGMPLTLLKLRQEDRYAVIEMGMNHAGEIDYLTRLARPTAALITNAGEAHLAGLGTIEDVARAKGEIFAGLVNGATAVINADDPFCGLWKQLAAPHRVLTFGLSERADVYAQYTLDRSGSAVHMQTPQGVVELHLPLLGRHNVMNALAASAGALAASAPLEDIAPALAKLKAIPGRLEVKPGISGACVIDDTYNANPASLAAGLHVLKDFTGERLLVLGDMGELGAQAPALHRRIGELARALGIQRVFGLGELARQAVAAFDPDGRRGARHFESFEALVDALHEAMHAELTVLVKGSRMMRMERIVDAIVRTDAREGLAPGRTH
jgi:UDP-N-acetylmuramoyl-tripeptide--D-alanyl-D-alanine ligase